MAAPWNPPKKGEDFEFLISLKDFSNPGSFKTNPTIAAGDFKITKDGGALANLTTLPVVEPASSAVVKVVLSSTEMNADKLMVIWQDQTAPKEWCDDALAILTTA